MSYLSAGSSDEPRTQLAVLLPQRRPKRDVVWLCTTPTAYFVRGSLMRD
jgi:hypothetical protein